MSAPSCTATRRALFSKDGRTWQDHSPVGAPPVPDPTVAKIVIGVPEFGQGKGVDLPGETLGMLGQLADLYPELTHLHLWGIRNLERLDALPAGLKELDLRGCVALTAPPGLPAALEVLDLGDCTGLTSFPKQGLARLRRLHVDRCALVPELRLNAFLEDCAALEELTASGCDQLMSLVLPSQAEPAGEAPSEARHPAFPRARLKRLVLDGCARLSVLPDLSVHPWLHHLNVNGCAALDTLPPLCADPGRGIRHLVTHGCDALRRFGAMDVRRVHLSDAPADNVASVFRTMGRLGGTPVEFCMSKVLLLGSGRCGKTTVAKALQGIALNPKELSTHGIQFWQHHTEFKFEKEVNPATGRPPATRPGTAHLWDFGGQEIYHNTHRLFASQGSVFIVVTTSPGQHAGRLEAELSKEDDRVERELLRRQNEYRGLKYWLDYIRSALGLENVNDLGEHAGRASVLVVYTGEADRNRALEDLVAQAGPYAELLRAGDLEVVAVDLFGCRDPFAAAQRWVARHLGRAADQFGVMVPEVFAKVATRCGAMLADPRSEDILEHRQWCDLVEECAPPLPPASGAATGLRLEQAEAALKYLHQCGRVFRLRRADGADQVVINQQWAADKIYILASRQVSRRIQAIAGGFFHESDLRGILDSCRECRGLSEPQKHALVGLLDQCDVCVRAGADDRWMAVQRELLPEATHERQQDLAREWETTAATDERMINHSFALHGDQGGLLGNADYRAVLAFVARGLEGALPRQLFGDDERPGRDAEPEWAAERGAGRGYAFESQVWFWRDGFMVRIARRRGEKLEPVVLRVEWSPRVDAGAGRPSYSSYEGGLFFQFLSPDEEAFAPRLRGALFGEAGPLAMFKDKVLETDKRPPDLSREMLPRLRGFGQPGWMTATGPARPALRYDVAISYRSSERALVEKLAAALKRNGLLNHYHYSDDEHLAAQRAEAGGSRITEIYDYLKFAKVLVVVASRGYLETPDLVAGKNLYCPVELAEAVLASKEYTPEECKAHGMTEPNRPPGRFFWVFAGADPPTAESVVRTVSRLLEHYFKNVSKKRWPKGRRTPGWTAIDRREYIAMEECVPETIATFLDAVGRDAKQMIAAKDPESDAWVRDLCARIDAALRSRIGAGDRP